MNKKTRLALIRRRADILRAAGKLGPRRELRRRGRDDGLHEHADADLEPRDFRDDEHDDTEW